MLAPVTRQFKDLSTRDSFRFAFYCDHCGEEWLSDLYAFSTIGFEPPVDEEIRTMLWNQQHGDAYERANREACVRFNRHLVNGGWLCDECFASVKEGPGAQNA